ncbi:nucleotidyl transferase AbiEii/AbiGii toxin family protein [Microtetraspora glauca]|uniref:Nucleotidyl transferase AbiEii/AbiGii toxin family protein n=1 Tax=Microtetraspora glauca TaxID=1996 RepID=A0ABV3GBG4_MICGL
MSPNPPRDTPEGLAYNTLRNLARRERRNTDDLITLYALEGFLRRLSSSDMAGQFILKGGLLLAAFGARRVTRDIDLMGRGFANDEQTVLSRVISIASMRAEDGLRFDVTAIRASAIREDDFYGGVRVCVPALLGKSRTRLQLDVSFGDPITPGPEMITYPTLVTGGGFPLLGYPMENVLAEKTITALERSSQNTRDRDYADIWRLTGCHDLDGASVRTALENTASHRGVTMKKLSDVILDLPDTRQIPYSAWRRKQGTDGAAYPPIFRDLVTDVVTFTDPVLAGEAGTGHWYALGRRWGP